MELFEDALERIRLRYLFVVSGYVVMPEHVHLLVNEPQRALLSKAVQALKLSVSMRGRERPFWQAHYNDFNVSTHEKFVEKCATCIATRSSAGSSPSPRTGRGPAMATT
jgi:putative transposase